LDRALMPLIVAIQTIPKVAVAPVLIIWFGFGIESKVVIVALIDFFPILVNAITGFRSSDPRQILLMRALNASPWQIFIKVRVFNAIPYLMAGMYIAIVLSVIGAVLGEFLGSARGLGSQIVQRQGSMDVVGVFSMLVILSAMGIVLNLAVRMASRRLAFWTREGEHSGL
jgi:NitT/TauT family transport system permease protein